ncbi:MAG: ATP-dependent DNA helicase RecG [Actinobacteria bacterium]|nr:ATP-dependent DNA helicase RecG [Actinomycetota bacterium]
MHELLADRLDIHTIDDLLHHYPHRHVDRSTMTPIRDLKMNEVANVIGKVLKIDQRLTRYRKSIVTIRIGDGTALLDLRWFNQPWIAQRYRQGMEVMASGKLGAFGGTRQLQNPTVEILDGDEAESVHVGRIIPFHPATEGVSAGMIRRLVFDAVKRVPNPGDPIPEEIRRDEGLIGLAAAFTGIHFPQDWEQLGAAKKRLKFDELFTLELGVAFRKRRVAAETLGVEHDLSGTLAKRFLTALPFEPTAGQRTAIAEIETDLGRSAPMNRLLQGDVGSGKTLVALYAAMVAIQSGHQAAIMAPTEVLAAQHFLKVREFLRPLGAYEVGEDPGEGQLMLGEDRPERELTYALLSASVTGKAKARVLEAVAAGEVDLVIGTHALVQEGVAFADLSLAVIDEQHRFGVHQRLTLKEKGGNRSPDILIMTATPIPRTLALTYYGDLDVSVLDELPAGRQPIETMIVRTEGERGAAYDLVRREIAAGRQAFVVCAAIDEGNRLEVKAAEAEADRLATQVFPDLRLELLHGRMRPADKQERMESFRAGRTDLLISTTVIEVGVDVPNATVMLVENAERFGLAQLHQLRGRIGRGAHRSYCVLFDESEEDNQVARARLQAMKRTTDGFDLADVDLELRGEGTLFDVKQAGMPDLKLARLSRDRELVLRARTRAFGLIEADPELARHPDLKRELEARFADAIEWLFHS